MILYFCMKTLSLSKLGMEDVFWKHFRTDDPYLHEKMFVVKNMKRRCYESIYEGNVVTLAVYEYKGEEVLKAWGYRDSIHCSYHAIKINGSWLEEREGCPKFSLIKNEKEEVCGYNLQ